MSLLASHLCDFWCKLSRTALWSQTSIGIVSRAFPFLTRLERLRAGRKINCLAYYKVAKIHLNLKDRAELSQILAEFTKHLRAFEWRKSRHGIVFGLILRSGSHMQYLFYNLGPNNMEQKHRNPPAPPPQSMMKSREGKNAPFFHPWFGGRGGLSVPFKMSKIAISVGITWNRHPVTPQNQWWSRAKGKMRHFSILDLEGGLV